MKKLCAYGVYCALVCSVGFITPRLWAQGGTTGTVTGQVTDQTGAIVAGAEVTLTDTSTKIYQTQPTNAVGRFIFINVKPGVYDLKVAMKGFRQSAVTGQEVIVGQVLTVNLALEVGAATQTVEVKATPGAELQTMNSTMGATVGGNALLNMPSLNRDATSLLIFQPTTTPTFGGRQGNTTGGQVAGSMSDQNTFMLDGGNATDDLAGDNNYVASNRTYVGPQASIPTPVESIQEFKVATNNQTADFSSSAGGQVMLVTKRGTNTFHGSLYDYFQAQFLNANSWNNNRLGNPKVKQHQNRFGGSVGGPLLPGQMLGGKTYFYFLYEGRRFPGVASFQEYQVPSLLMRQGILQFTDSSGNIVQYNLATSKQCGSTGTLQCDPRGIGLNPVVSQLWNKYEPLPNDTSFGDTLNTQGYRAPLVLPQVEDNVVTRIDHDFGAKWRAFASYRYYRDLNPTTNQVDIGGLLPGDKLGVPASGAATPLHPVYLVAGLSGTISPTLTNEFHFSYLRDFWQWTRAGVVPQIAGIPAGIEFGENHNLVPLNYDTQNTRYRIWNGHDWTYNDTLSWLKGNHFTQFGGTAIHWWDHHVRNDAVVSALTQLVYQLNQGSTVMSANFQPQNCVSGSITTNCLPTSQVGNWNSLYSNSLGFVGTASQLFVRGGSNFTLTGAPAGADTTIMNQYSMFFNDSWHIKPNLTLNYGLEWGVQLPPYEINGVQDYFTDANGATITTQQYLSNKQNYALQGLNYNPAVGFEPIRAVGGSPKYPFQPFYGGFSPRVSLAWSPSFNSGVLGTVFGNKRSVIRGGYARIYDRTNSVDMVLTPLLGYGFLQPINCSGAGTNGLCNGASITNPNTAFRLGVDGNTAPFPAVTQTLPVPAIPGVNTPPGVNISFLDNAWRPGSNDSIDITVQRELPDSMIVEAGYVGKWSKHLYQGIDINDVPWMMTMGGQTFAQAYDALYAANLAGTAAAPQAFFESALLGSSKYCTGFSSCTAGVLAFEGSKGTKNITNENVYNIWQDIDKAGPGGTSAFKFGPSLTRTVQGINSMYGNSTLGFSNYQAGFISIQKRAGHGLTMSGNLTWSHTLATDSINQEYTANSPTNPFNLHTDYGPAPWDRRWVLNMLGNYELPFGKGKRFSTSNGIVDRVIGGWSFSPIFTWATGAPIETFSGSCEEFGQGLVPNCGGVVPLVDTHTLSNTAHFNVQTGCVIGVNGDPTCKGHSTAPGQNMFSNPTAAYNSFRPLLVGIDNRAYDEGPLYGQHRWNVDFSLAKETKINERVATQFYAEFLNALNIMEYSDPSINLQNPSAFGVLGTGSTPQYSFPRVIQLGLRISF